MRISRTAGMRRGCGDGRKELHTKDNHSHRGETWKVYKEICIEASSMRAIATCPKRLAIVSKENPHRCAVATCPSKNLSAKSILEDTGNIDAL